MDALTGITNTFNKEYTSPCSKTEYEGTQLYYELLEDLPTLFANYNVERVAIFTFAFVSPETMTMHEEFFIYGFFGLIGYVGGIMCIFVSFSFLDATLTCMQYLNTLLTWMKKFKKSISRKNDSDPKMERKKQLVKKVLYWILFLLLAMFAIMLSLDTFKSYTSKKTNMSFETIPIAEHPTITICFGKETGSHWDRRMYSLGNEFNITYYLNET